MKKLMLFLAVSFMTSAWAFEGTYVSSTDMNDFIPQGQIRMTEGFSFVQGRFQSLDVILSHQGLEYTQPSGRVFKSSPSLIEQAEKEGLSSTGLSTAICSSTYGVAIEEGNSMLVTRWELEREVNWGCPLSKNPNLRGLKNGKRNEIVLRFVKSGNDLVLEKVYGLHKTSHKLTRIK